MNTDLIGESLTWKRTGPTALSTGAGWRLFNGKRRLGDVVPDSKEQNMWRVVLSGGHLSDYANLSWARNAVLEAATRELEYEAWHPSITRDLRGVFQGASPQVSLTQPSSMAA